MNVFLIKHSEREYDYYLGHVIIANNKDEVIKLAKKNSRDEGEKIWDEAMITMIGEYTGNRKRAFVLLSDFNAG